MSQIDIVEAVHILELVQGTVVDGGSLLVLVEHSEVQPFDPADSVLVEVG